MPLSGSLKKDEAQKLFSVPRYFTYIYNYSVFTAFLLYRTHSSFRKNLSIVLCTTLCGLSICLYPVFS